MNCAHEASEERRLEGESGHWGNRHNTTQANTKKLVWPRRQRTLPQSRYISKPFSDYAMLRSYHVEYTGSHQNSEVKLRWAGLVLG
jgi:hypothetical protein